MVFGDVTRNAAARFIRTRAGRFRSLVQFPVVIKRTDAHLTGQLCHGSGISFRRCAVLQKESVPLVTMTDAHIQSITKKSPACSAVWLHLSLANSCSHPINVWYSPRQCDC